MPHQRKALFYTLGSLLFLFILNFIFFSPPADFPVGAVVRIDSGLSLHGASAILKNEHIIKSRVAFESLVVIFGAEHHLVSADYLFEQKLSVFEVASRMAGGAHRTPPVTVTIPEGYDNSQIAEAFSANLTNFDKAQFLLLTKDMQGYLFPDTYFFLTDDNENDAISSMQKNFDKKITPILPEISASGHSEKDIIIMASIIEREAKGEADRALISGILWKRLKIGMPLQVNAALETYKTKGLPKKPIANPGLAAIEAAIHPTSSPYLYYLHDKNGGIHYAKTFAEHKLNEAKYLGRK